MSLNVLFCPTNRPLTLTLERLGAEMFSIYACEQSCKAHYNKNGKEPIVQLRFPKSQNAIVKQNVSFANLFFYLYSTKNSTMTINLMLHLF